jgi:hypothetical protein
MASAGEGPQQGFDRVPPLNAMGYYKSSYAGWSRVCATHSKGHLRSIFAGIGNPMLVPWNILRRDAGRDKPRMSEDGAIPCRVN